MTRSRTIKKDVFFKKKDTYDVFEKAIKLHKKNKNGCPYWVGITIGDKNCAKTKARSKALCKGCTLPKERGDAMKE